MDYFGYTVVFVYSHEPSPTSAEGCQSGIVTKVDDEWRVGYENSVTGDWESEDDFKNYVTNKFYEEGPEQLLVGVISEENFDYQYDGSDVIWFFGDRSIEE